MRRLDHAYCEESGLTSQLVQGLRTPERLTDLASRRTTLRKVGRRLRGVCPICSNAGESGSEENFYVDPGQGLFYCFGCGNGGDAIKLSMLLTGQSFEETVEIMAHPRAELA